MNKKADIQLLTVGDASMDVFLTPTESDTFCRIDSKECFLSFAYGDKIPVKDLSFSVGGNAANNAVGTRRLGVNSAVILTLGDDETGDHIINKLKSEGVNCDYVVREKNTSSNYSTAITVYGERTLFTYKSPKKKYHLPDEFPNTPWIYLTSMGDGFENVFDRVVEHVGSSTDIKLAYNPGSRQLRAGVDKSLKVLKVAYILYVNRKEAEMFAEMSETHGKEKELLKKLCTLGPKIPIVTDGANGSFVFDGEKYYKAEILPVDSYERTGAGDSFGSGCIAALIEGKPIEEALLWGTVNSASVIGYAGAQRGLLKENEIKEWLERAKSCDVRVETF
jgi:sugar/nucleoside kinase (ribokinase family)